MTNHVQLFSALADPVRFRIVERLREGEASVGDVVRIAHIQQSGVSRHLGILCDAGIAQVRRDGQRRLYSLRREPFADVASWIDDVRRIWEPRLDRLEDALARRAALKSHRKDS